MNNFDDEHMPKDPVFKPEAGSVKEMLLKEEVKGYYERKKLAISNLKKIYALVWGQCSEQLQAAIKLDENYEEKSKKYDGVWLLKNVKKMIAGMGETKNKEYILHKKLQNFYLIRQFENETVQQYLERFKSNLQSLKMIGGERVLCNETLMSLTWEQLYAPGVDEETRNTAIKEANEKLIAMRFFMGENDKFLVD